MSPGFRIVTGPYTNVPQCHLAVHHHRPAPLLLSRYLPLKDGVAAHPAHKQEKKQKFPSRFWIFASFILLYGVCETMNGNWASLYMKKHFASSEAISSLALSLFWGAITGGRVLFATLEKWFPD